MTASAYLPTSTQIDILKAALARLEARRPAAQSFGLTTTVGNVEGDVLRYQMSADGTFSVAVEPLDSMTDEALEAMVQAVGDDGMLARLNCKGGAQ